MQALTADFLGTPLYLWVGFISLVIVLLALDLGLFNRKAREIGVRDSLIASAFYIAAGLLFGLWIYFERGSTSALEYVTGFAIEKSLAMDNIFVIAMIFTALSIPRANQHRVLFWGILGVIVLRGLMIAGGTALVNEFHWVLGLFGAFLVFTGIRMAWPSDTAHDISDNKLLNWLRGHLPVTDGLRGQAFIVRETDPKTGKLKRFVTPLFLALIMVEIIDLIFAIDSIPAIFAVTTDPFIVYTSNIFAILGLRALYFALAAMMHRFAYLKYALAAVLVFVGGKIIAADVLDMGKFPPAWSLAITLGLIACGILGSLWATRGKDKDVTHKA